MEGRCLEYPGTSTMASHFSDGILPSWLANPWKLAMSSQVKMTAINDNLWNAETKMMAAALVVVNFDKY